MKYKLINLKTKEEHLCDKVTIGNFDYYVGDKCNDLGGWHIDKEFKILSNVSRFNVVTEMKEVIATNNPNIDIPKVVDEVNEIKKNLYFYKQVMNPYETGGQSYTAYEKGFIEGYNKSQETHPFSEEDMIDLLNFVAQKMISLTNFRMNDKIWASDVRDKKLYSSKEIIQIWKEQQPKIVYYG